MCESTGVFTTKEKARYPALDSLSLMVSRVTYLVICPHPT